MRDQPSTTEVGEDAGADRKRRAPQQRRQEILDAAARIFDEKGYEATSIQDVADAVGILKGSLYYYIDSKEDLLFGIIEEAHLEGLANLERIEDMEADTLTQLRALLEAHVLSNMRNRTKVGVFFHDFRSLSGERHDTIVSERDRYDEKLRALIEQAQEEGVIVSELDAKIVSLGILGMLNWVYQWYSPDGPFAAEEIAAQFADLALGGLAVDDGRPPTRREIGECPEGILDPGSDEQRGSED